MVMRRYISHLFTWVISFLTLLAFSSCLNEHPKDQLDGGGSNGSASEIFDTTIAPLYDFMGGTIDGEGICDIQRLDSLLSLSPDDEQLYSSWQYLYRAIGMCNKSLDMIDFQSVRLTDNRKAQFKAEVRAIRAMMYYEAMDLYGRIPVLLSAAESLIYEPASGSSVTDEKLSAQSERSEIFHFIFSELQQVLPYLPQTSSLEEGSHYGRITQPVVNFLLAKLALNAEIYMYNDWAQGYRKRPKGRNLEFMVRTADGASLITGGKASENRSRILNAWETCIFYCNRLADEGCSLEEDEIFNSSARYLMPKDALVMDEADSVLHSRPAKPLFRFRYADVLLMKAEAMERNDGDGRAEYNMVVRMPFCLRASLRLPIFWKTVRLCWRARLVTVRTLSVSASSSSPRIFAVLFSPLSRPLPSSSRYLSEALPSMASWFRTKDMRQWNSPKLFIR